MKVVVMGGTGLIGSKVVSLLRERGNDVVAASLKAGVNVISGDGLKAALDGADFVVDVLNSPSFEKSAVFEFFSTSSRNLLAAERQAGIRHHVALSVVGIDRPPGNDYFRAKLEQERLIREGGVPFTILRATQFFEFLGGIADTSTDGATVRLSPAMVQPIAADDVAAALADVVTESPRNDVLEIAGPDLIGLADAVERFLQTRHDERAVISDVHAPYFGMELDDGSLTPGEGPWVGSTHIDDWLAATPSR